MINFDDNEHIILEVRRHWFVLIPQLIMSVLAIILPVFLYMIYLDSIATYSENQNDIIFWFTYSAWLLIILIYNFVFWTNYYLDIWIVTNQKIYYITQNGIFSRQVATLHLDKIQDISVEIQGIMATFLDFGDITVQTAGNDKEFHIKEVERPNLVREKINETIEQHSKNLFS